MLYVIIAISFAVALFCGIYWWDIEREDTHIAVKIIFFAALTIFITSVLAVIIFLSKNWEDVETETNRKELVCLQDNSQVSGHGSVFYVKVETNEFYCYYYKTEDGGIKMGKVNAENAVIYQGDYEPCIIEKTSVKKPINMSATTARWLLCTRKVVYEIYVPEGTIVETFSLDAN